ncbi:MAG: hypothetical protein A2015_08560 [Spirochaetes bacterium GWF1_31_7]|nr:MAG: hypothetical protein A2Y30_07100 [Spirochaetes bacterium GWE1_32_154]OHD47975.1 MAG: hypothetical protein A2015_08560 [Spirochaetes bacterium GWF1_31_7]OHD48066.1 MAG: hypothetical protein A2Y29_07895 [Spirochaetes bacterium GWE2_31_10]OHD81203.1 MAG: hypothetical protein A2355_00350 [Spirochaetes bacterium RIFOXYB1_FULL_32_8]HBD94085.1 hypothetical protein [Spirochaetia bacterium]
MQDIQIVDPQESKYFIGQSRNKMQMSDSLSGKNRKIVIFADNKEPEINTDTGVNVEQLVKELKKYNNQLQYFDKEIKLSINEEIDRVIVTVINKNTNEVIYEYPYKEMQQLAAHLKDMTGFMFDSKV